MAIQINIPAAEQEALFRRMLLIRKAEERLARDFKTGELPGSVHLYIGQEAVATGVCAHLDDSDWIASTHRGHGHFLAKDGDPFAMFAEIRGRSTGICGGMGGSMHVADISRGILGANGIVGGGIGLAVGAALAAQLDGKGRVAVAFFGDGAAAQGVLAEALNIAALWKLPLLLLCENNGYSEFSPTQSVIAGSIAERGVPFGVPSLAVDGNDVVAVWEAAHEAVERARNGGGPTPDRGADLPVPWSRRGRGRLHPHALPDRGGGRSATIGRSGGALPRRPGGARCPGRGATRRDRGRDRGRHRRRRDTRRGRTLSRARFSRPAGGALTMARKRMIHAINDALFEEMERDERVILFGEDVSTSIFGDTRGLRAKFGADRVRDTPISEAVMSGMAVGAAAAGYRIVCHLMYANFIYTAFDAIANQATKLRLMTNGQIRLPITYMAVGGGGRSNSAQHSDMPHAALASLGGLHVVVPGSSADAKGLLKSAIRSDDPSVFIQPASRGGEMGDVPDEETLVPLGRAALLRPGTHVTLVAIGSMVRPALRAAAELAEDGIDVEVLDPRTVFPSTARLSSHRWPGPAG